jgi:hypothetical protein
MAVAWIYFVKQKGLSPLMPGQWKAFLAYYAGMLGEINSDPHQVHAAGSPVKLEYRSEFRCAAGFWTIQNFVRPLRFALAVAMAPVFDGFMNFVQHRFGCRKQTAFAGCPCECACHCLPAVYVSQHSVDKSLTTAVLNLQCTLHCLALPPPRLFLAAFMHLRDHWPTLARRQCCDLAAWIWSTEEMAW